MYKFVLIAMSPLALLAMIAGFFQEEFNSFITTSLEIMPNYEMSHHTHELASYLGLIVLVFAIGGILLAYKKYSNSLVRNEKVENGFIYKLLKNQYYIPAFYSEFISKPYASISTMLWKSVDMKIVDATVDGIANIFYKGGDNSRKMQTGNLSHYLNWMAVGLVLMLLVATIYALIA